MPRHGEAKGSEAQPAQTHEHEGQRPGQNSKGRVDFLRSAFTQPAFDLLENLIN